MIVSTLLALSVLQRSTGTQFEPRIEKVLSALHNPTSASMASIIDAKGLTVYYLYPDRTFTFSPRTVTQLLKTGKRFTWVPAMQGDGGMRNPIRMSLNDMLHEAGATNWHVNATLARGKSPTPTYRTLYIQDFAKKHPGVSFLDINRTDPKISEMREFQSALILGFSKAGKLRVLGFDAWKD